MAASTDDTKKISPEASEAIGGSASSADASGEINPHIPQFISRAPWYLNQSKPSLTHQRFQPQQKVGLHAWYKRGLVTGQDGEAVRKKSKFLKGSCLNCGSGTHSAKDCTERPRAKPAKYSNKDLQPDEIIEPPPELNYEAKRDRYGGYDGGDFKWRVREYEALQLERRRRKQLEQQRAEDSKKQEKKRAKQRRPSKSKEGGDATAEGEAREEEDTDTDTDSESSGDEDVKLQDFDTCSAPVTCSDSRNNINVKNLRIREDTAKYLLNLDLGSAFYDPKSRSLRGDPFAGTNATHAGNPTCGRGVYRGDNELLKAGMVGETQKLQLFAWEAYKHGQNVHFNAQPTQLEFLYKEHQRKKQEMEEKKRSSVFDKYGGKEHLTDDTRLLYAQTDSQNIYTRDGVAVKARDRVFVRSIYEEDIFPGNHSSVWGSFFSVATQMWGFACCRQTQRDAPCLGRVEDSFAAEAAAFAKTTEEKESIKEEAEASDKAESPPVSSSEREDGA